MPDIFQQVSALQNTRAVATRTKPLPWPVWSGDESQYPGFHNALVHKVDSDSQLGLLGSNKDIWYQVVYTALPASKRGKVEAFWARGGTHGNHDLQDLFTYLVTVFGTGRKKATALADLPKLKKEPGQPFGDWFPDFEGLLMTAGGWEWPDDSKIMLLKNALDVPLLEALNSNVTQPTVYEQFKLFLQNIAWTSSGVTPYASVPARQSAQTPAPTEPEVDADGDVRMNSTRFSNGGRGGRRQSSGSTQTTERKCFGCGSTKHLRRDCPREGKSVQIRTVPPGQSRVSEQDAEALVTEFQESGLMETDPTTISVIINDNVFFPLVDEGCLCYAAISEELVEELRLPVVGIAPREVTGASSAMGSTEVQGIATFIMDVQGFAQPVCAYVVPMLSPQIILGKPWLEHNKAYSVPHMTKLWHGRA
ncbi:hypothetical protein V8F20_012851, partial [Naviculisporaceae sp. PSN 640]